MLFEATVGRLPAGSPPTPLAPRGWQQEGRERGAAAGSWAEGVGHKGGGEEEGNPRSEMRKIKIKPPQNNAGAAEPPVSQQGAAGAASPFPPPYSPNLFPPRGRGAAFPHRRPAAAPEPPYLSCPSPLAAAGTLVHPPSLRDSRRRGPARPGPAQPSPAPHSQARPAVAACGCRQPPAPAGRGSPPRTRLPLLKEGCEPLNVSPPGCVGSQEGGGKEDEAFPPSGGWGRGGRARGQRRRRGLRSGEEGEGG